MPANLTGPVIQQSGVAKKLEGPAASLDIQEGRTEPQATGHKLQATSFYFFFWVGPAHMRSSKIKKFFS
tara:strand:- start:1063 stop:1269 length:207 start_codon:yes stop_codon:yes gene_type:complete